MVDAHARAVDHPHIATVSLCNSIHDPVPDACLGPSPEAVVAGRVRAVALRQVPPWRTRAQNPEDAVQHAAVIDARHPSWLVGQKRRDKPVKITLDLPADVHRDLVAYAEALARENGQTLEPAKLIAPMLARFMATDRAFAKQRRQKPPSSRGPAPGSQTA